MVFQIGKVSNRHGTQPHDRKVSKLIHLTDSPDLALEVIVLFALQNLAKENEFSCRNNVRY